MSESNKTTFTESATFKVGKFVNTLGGIGGSLTGVAGSPSCSSKPEMGLRAAIFRDVEIRFSEAANRLPFAVCYNHIDAYGAGLRLKSRDKGLIWMVDFETEA